MALAAAPASNQQQQISAVLNNLTTRLAQIIQIAQQPITKSTQSYLLQSLQDTFALAQQLGALAGTTTAASPPAKLLPLSAKNRARVSHVLGELVGAVILGAEEDYE